MQDLRCDLGLLVDEAILDVPGVDLLPRLLRAVPGRGVFVGPAPPERFTCLTCAIAFAQ